MKQYRSARWLVVFTLLAAVLAFFIHPASAQSGRKARPTETRPRVVDQNGKPVGPDGPKGPEKTGAEDKPLAVTTPVEIDENGVIKLDTFLVTMPVSVTDRYGKFEPFLKKSDFHLYEDGVEQTIESFESVEVPFHVALVLDTSNSTKFKLEDIQEAAAVFVNQLRPDDQVMVVSFDSAVHVESEFTSDRQRLRRAIFQTRTGGSTKLYEAVDLALAERLDRIQGRKAVVLFTDGVDTSSRRATAQSTLEQVEESDTLVFPIRYDTEESNPSGIGIPGRTPPIGWPMPNPRGGSRRRWPFLAQPVWQLTGQWPQGRWPGGRGPQPGGTNGDYQRGARYLQDLADRSGGRLYQADTLSHVSQAFSLIAEELRYQYRLSYYPGNSKKDGAFRKIKVRVDKPDLIVRSRDGYRAAADTQANDSNERPALKRKQLASQ